MEIYNRPEDKPAAQPEADAPPPTPASTTSPALPQPLPGAPTLEQIIKQNHDLPAQAAVLGVCDDGLPVLLDLHDPAPGGLIVIGDEREAQLDMLRNALASLAGRGSPRTIQFIILSCEPQKWQAWVEEKGYSRYCLAVESADAGVASDWIIQLADWTEQRRLGQTSGPSVLLVMDTLSFLPSLPYDIRLNFEWMATEGPPAQIWPLAVISTDLAKALTGRRMLRAFHTRVLGYADQAADYVPLAGLDSTEAQTFGRRGTFQVKAGDTWLRFRLPGQ